MESKTLTISVALIIAISTMCLGRTIHVDRNHNAAADANPGTAVEPLLTIQRAAALAQPGDTIRIHKGVYRETVRPPRGGEPGRPIVYEGDPGGGTIVRGSVVWNGRWTKADSHAGYTAPIDFPLDEEYTPYALALNVCHGYEALRVRPVTNSTEDLVATTGQLFVNSEPCRQVAAVADLAPRTWMVSRDGRHIHLRMPEDLSPEDADIEVTTRKHLFMPRRRGFGYIHLQHLTFEHCAAPGPFPQRGMVSTRTGHHWLIEHCVFAHSTTIGLDCGSEGYAKTFVGVYDDNDEYESDNSEAQFAAHSHIVRYNRVAHNGVCGVAVYRIRNAIFYGNTFEDNANVMQLLEPGRKKVDAYRTDRICWNEYAALKSHGFRDSVVMGNLFAGNYKSLFLDTEFNGALVHANVFLRNHANSLILERCWADQEQSYVINNLFIENGENDVRSMDLSRTTVAHNLFIKNPTLTDYDLEYYDTNRSSPLYFQFNYKPGTRRMRRPYRVSVIGNRVMNNVLLGHSAALVVLPPNNLPGPLRTYYRDNRFDYNVFDTPQFCIHQYGFPEEHKRKITGKEEIGLDAWRSTMGNGRHSTVFDANVHGTIRVLDDTTIELDLKPAFLELETESIPRRRVDFFGKPVPEDGAPPGPFTELLPGRQRLTIWPVPVDDRDVERLVGEGRIQDLL
jgi:hypothetical protein